MYVRSTCNRAVKLSYARTRAVEVYYYCENERHIARSRFRRPQKRIPAGCESYDFATRANYVSPEACESCVTKLATRWIDNYIPCASLKMRFFFLSFLIHHAERTDDRTCIFGILGDPPAPLSRESYKNLHIKRVSYNICKKKRACFRVLWCKFNFLQLYGARAIRRSARIKKQNANPATTICRAAIVLWIKKKNVLFGRTTVEKGLDVALRPTHPPTPGELSRTGRKEKRGGRGEDGERGRDGKGQSAANK